MANSHSHSSSHGDHPLVGHLVPLRILVATGSALLALTVITVAVRYIDLGEINLYVALGLAAVKAILVGLFFMHLWWDRPFNQLIFVASVLFVALLIAFCMMDVGQYASTIYSGNPKGVQDVLNKDAPNAPIAKDLQQKQ